MTHLAKLTQKEFELYSTILELVKQGERDKGRIYRLSAARLHIAEATVRSRLSRLRSKYFDVLMPTVRQYRGWQQTLFQLTGGQFNPLGRSGKGK